MVLYEEILQSAKGMNLENIKNYFLKLTKQDLSQKQKIVITASFAWIIFIGYLTWWNGLRAPTLDKSFNHKFSNHATGGDGETSAIQFSTTNASNPSLPDPNPGSWISYDIPFSSFAAAAANGITLRDEIAQYLITSNLGTVYIDNIYVYRAATASVEDNLFNVSLYPNPASNRLNISAANTIQNAEIYNVLGKKVMSVNINKANGSIDVSNLSSGIYLIKYNVNDKVGTAKFIKQ